MEGMGLCKESKMVNSWAVKREEIDHVQDEEMLGGTEYGVQDFGGDAGLHELGQMCNPPRRTCALRWRTQREEVRTD